MIKKIITITILIITLVSVLSVRQSIDAYSQGFEEEYAKIAESESLILYYNYSNYRLCIEDKRNSYVWYASITPENYDMNSLNEMLRNSIQAMFLFSYYTTLRPYSENIVLTNSLSEKADVNVNNIKNGLVIEYNFNRIGISLTVKIILGDDYLDISIPDNMIKESSTNYLYSLQILPYFGAAKNGENGYMFFPDGSGSIMYFEENGQSTFQYSIYGTDRVDIEHYDKLKKQSTKQAMLPVYGVKKDNNAFLAVLTNGEFDATINLSQPDSAVALNRINASFQLRRTYVDPRTQTYGTIRNVIAPQRIKSERSLRYLFLEGNNADYSGMANTYRKYLLENELINNVMNSDNQIPLGIDFIMGVKQERILFDKYIAMTTFDNTLEILKKLADLGVRKIQTGLSGWQRHGFGAYPDFSTPARKLGGSNGLTNLTEYTKDNNVLLFLQDNYIDADKKYRGFSPRNDVVYQRNGFVVTDLYKTRFILNPFSAFKKFNESLLKVYTNHNIDGIKYEKIGELIFYDFNKANTLTREDTAGYWTQLIQKSVEKFGLAAVEGGNSYVLKNASRLYSIPDTDSGYFFTGQTVPFYQMVVHGLIPYSSETPGNMSHDFNYQKLKWVEYGSIPYFVFTYKPSSLFKNTPGNHLYSTQYSDWYHTASEVYKEFSDRLGGVWGRYMSEHKKIAENIYRITYDNGTSVYVNYNESVFHVDGNTVDPLDYIVIDKDGNVK